MNQASGSLSRRLPSTGDRRLDVGLLGLLLMLIAFSTYGIRKKQQQGNN
ncbi:LPXTG cell wall anchor domain-containing protein [Enterococcus malodoratus]